jgi:hypothetical protein
MPRLQKIVIAMKRLSKAAKQYNTSFYFQAKRFKSVHDNGLFSLDDALLWGLTDPALPEDVLGNYMSREAASRLRKRVNPKEEFASVNDKALFYRICTQTQLPFPETFGVFVSGASQRSTDGKLHLPGVDLDSLPEGAFVAKPVWGREGIGLWFFVKTGDVFDVGGRLMDAGSLREELRKSASNDDFIVQRRMVPHPSLSSISGSIALQSARMVTFVDSHDKAHILFARFKIIRQGNNIDNFDEGTTGNLIADVDIETGKITKVFTKIQGQVGLQRIFQHPDTGKDLSFVLPDWEQAVQLACKAARTFNRIRSLGWDIGFTDRGPVILEANQEWGILAIAPYRKPVPIGEWESLIR